MRAPTLMYEPSMPPTIPPGMTIGEWRRARTAIPRDREMRWRRLIPGRRKLSP
jgi:hypothetical protein